MDTVLKFADGQAFRRWLEEHAAESAGVWLLFGKKGGPATLTSQEALEEALCFGWIDGQLQKLDDFRYRKYFARRNTGSRWSEKNLALAQRLIDADRMTPQGMKALDRALKAGPRSMPDSAAMRVFTELLQRHPCACANFLSMSASVRRTYAGFYFEAKSEKTRRARLEKIVGRLNGNLKPM